MSAGGIGVQTERTLHQTLKRYVEPDTRYHEVPCGNFIADVLRDGRIFEIQTKDLYRLAHKLEYYLAEGYQVTMVLPLMCRRFLRWVDPTTGEVSKPRRIGRSASLQDVFEELYRIRHLFGREGLSLRVLALEVEELKLQDGYGPQKKKGASRMDRRIREVLCEFTIEKTAQLRAFLPQLDAETFTAKDYARAAKCSDKVAATALRMLTMYGITERVGKQKNAYLYHVVETAEIV